MAIDTKDVLNNFPFPKFRPYQKKIIKEIVEAFNSDYRWILLGAPTGFGKSPVNVAFCNNLRSFYTTPQNILLDQINHEFSDLALIKGRKHYPCVEEGSSNCDNGPCQRDDAYVCKDKYDRCNYWQAKIHATKSQTALTNFSYFIGENFIPEDFPYRLGDRELLVIDEGHNIDEHVLNFISIIISKRTLPPSVFEDIKETLLSLPERLQPEHINNLLEETVYSCRNCLKILKGVHELNKAQVTDKKKAQTCIRNSKIYKNNLDAEWVGQIENKKYPEKWIRARIQPIYVKNFMHKYLWKRADRFIISSATLFWRNFIEECGLSDHDDETRHIVVPSTFPISNRKIIDATVGSLSWKKRKENLPAALYAIDNILNIEKRKGIIHAHSYAFADAIKKIPNPRLMYHSTGKNRDEALEKFLESPPENGKVFVTVAMTEGLDLKGDKATFQILFKCPYANYREDLRVYRRLIELGHSSWYRIQALKTVIQAYGRAVRSKKDKANFYIVDSSVISLCTILRKELPTFFKEAYDVKERFDEPKFTKSLPSRRLFVEPGAP